MFQVHDGDWSQPPATKVSFKVVNADHGNPSMLHNHQLHILEGVLPSSALSLVLIPQITQVREVCCIRKISNRLPVVFTICFLCFQVWLVYWKMLSPWDDFTLWKVVVVGGGTRVPGENPKRPALRMFSLGTQESYPWSIYYPTRYERTRYNGLNPIFVDSWTGKKSKTFFQLFIGCLLWGLSPSNNFSHLGQTCPEIDLVQPDHN